MDGWYFPWVEIERRVYAFRDSLAEAGVDGAVVLQRADLVYLLGTSFQGALLCPSSGGPQVLVWRGRGRVPPGCPWPVVPVDGAAKFPPAVWGTGFKGWRKVGFEADVLPVAWFHRMVEGVWPGAEFVDVSNRLRALRAVKSPLELERVRRSGAALVAGFQAIRGFMKEGMLEFEVQSQMDLSMRRAGDQAAGRIRGFNAEARGVVACGPSASVENVFDGPIGQPGRNPQAPLGAGDGVVRRDCPIIVDATAGFGGYMTDMTRVYYFGELEARFAEAHDFCARLLEETRRKMVPGAVPEELYLCALDEAEKAGFGEWFMNRRGSRVRFLGHGIGIEMDETPALARRVTDPLKEGMVLAVEPKIIFDDGGVGVEDTVIVRPGGGETVTQMSLEPVRIG